MRGSDHLTNTATQIQLIENLNGDVPVYGHHSLLVDLAGDNLSKRLGSLSIRDLRNSGVEPMALNNLMSTLGSSNSPKILHSLNDVASYFEINSFGSAPTKFDLNLLNSMSSKVLRDTPINIIKKELLSEGSSARHKNGAVELLPISGNLSPSIKMSCWSLQLL